MGFNTDIYVRDKYTGDIHRVGDDPHDSLYVDDEGTLHYYNLQNGDGCSAYKSINKTTLKEAFPDLTTSRDGEYVSGYEFVSCYKECQYCEGQRDESKCPFEIDKKRKEEQKKKEPDMTDPTVWLPM